MFQEYVGVFLENCFPNITKMFCQFGQHAATSPGQRVQFVRLDSRCCGKRKRGLMSHRRGETRSIIKNTSRQLPFVVFSCYLFSLQHVRNHICCFVVHFPSSTNILLKVCVCCSVSKLWWTVWNVSLKETTKTLLRCFAITTDEVSCGCSEERNLPSGSTVIHRRIHDVTTATFDQKLDISYQSHWESVWSVCVCGSVIPNLSFGVFLDV